MTYSTMRVHTIRTFLCIFLFVWNIFVVIYGEEIQIQCEEYCTNLENFNPDVAGGFFCDQSCKIEQCQFGCSQYVDAIGGSCQQACSSSNIERQSCTAGCLSALELYSRQIEETWTSLPAPELKHGSKTSTQLTLQWKGTVHPNVTYYVQNRMTDTKGDWEIYNMTTIRPDRDIQITNLHPYVTYKFRILLVITSAHMQQTQESEEITTLPEGAPSSPPAITDISVPMPTVISITWLPPLFSNGPILGYRLTVDPVNHPSLRRLNAEVPGNFSTWMLHQLQPSQPYMVSVSAWNKDGEGPAAIANVTTPNPGNIPDGELAYLIFGADNMVLKQNLEDLLSTPLEMHQTTPASKLITGIGIHVKRRSCIVTESKFRVHEISLDKVQLHRKDMFPSLVKPSLVTIDWLQDIAYILDDLHIQQCQLDGHSCILATDELNTTVTDMHIDPINGYLYFTQTSPNSGVYRIDTGEISPSHRAKPVVVIAGTVKAFYIDQSNMQLFFPNESLNTMMSSSLDGSDVQNLRSGNVIHPKFRNVTSMVYYNGTFVWTNGKKVLTEESMAGKFYHNSLQNSANSYAYFNLYRPSEQPHPIPHSPPRSLQALFAMTNVTISWQPPQQLQSQGKGAWNQWSYTVCITNRNSKEDKTLTDIKSSHLEVPELEPETKYSVRVRACSHLGCGPWSNVFMGKTLPSVDYGAMVILTKQEGLRLWVYEYDLYGQQKKSYFNLNRNGGILDMTLTPNGLLWIGADYKVYYASRKQFLLSNQLTFIGQSTTSIAFDWLALKVYWSMYDTAVIRRADMGGNSIEFIAQGSAIDLAVDSVHARLYWATLSTIEVAYLNGEDQQEYFKVPLFSGRMVISLTLNFDLGKIFWFVKGFGTQDLYMSDLLGLEASTVTSATKPVGTFKHIRDNSKLHYFAEHLFWLNEEKQITLGDLTGNHSSIITKNTCDMFTVEHQALWPLPNNMRNTSLNLVPDPIQAEKIECQGHWSHFNITWPALLMNYSFAFYEVSIKAENFSVFQKTRHTWYEVQTLAPYTSLQVTIRGYTYWAFGPVTISSLYSPMSVPSKPLRPRVYVTQYKDTATSQHSQAADFRWSAPDNPNGIITHYIVSHWASGEGEVNSGVHHVEKQSSARHFTLGNLMMNSTYHFQVAACTKIGCGERTELVSAHADVVNPLPMLLVLTSSSIALVEVDTFENKTNFQASSSAVSYLAMDSRLFWVTKGNNNVIQSKNSSLQKLMQLNQSCVDMTINWISRSLYFVEENAHGSSISQYYLDQDLYVNLQDRPQKIGSIVTDPYSSMMFWTEEIHLKNNYIVYAMNERKEIAVLFDALRPIKSKIKRDVACNCPTTNYFGRAMTIDHFQDNKMELILYDVTNSVLMATDPEGCVCRRMIRKDQVSPIGNGPSKLTVDHQHYYWLNDVDSKLFSISKDKLQVNALQLSGIQDVVSYGSHLQQLPGLDCLDPVAYQGGVHLIRSTNFSVTVMLALVKWPDECEGISHPNTKYTVYYKQGTNGDKCNNDGSDCLSQSSYSRQVTLTNLEPYTEYIVHGAVSNYYTEYLSEALGEPTIIRTKVGVPSPPVDVVLNVMQPTSMEVQWEHPLQSNGIPSEIVYKIHWSTMYNGEISNKEKRIRSSELQAENNGYLYNLADLLPNHKYTVVVSASNYEQIFFNEAPPMSSITFEQPNDIELVSRKSDSLKLSWRSPKDGSIVRHIVLYEVDGRKNKLFLEKTKQDTLYSFDITNLRPTTDVLVQMEFLLKSSSLKRGQGNAKVTFPEGSYFTFRTLSSTPALPKPPEIKKLNSQGYEVVWNEPIDNGEPIQHYLLQYRQEDSDLWQYAYNGSETRWSIDDDVTPPGYVYVFRVKAKNSMGWSPFSNSSMVFTHVEAAMQVEKATSTIVTVIGVSVALLLIFILVIICVFRRKRQQDLKKKPTHFVAVAHGPDMELATLRELPLSAYQQSNTLYAVSIIPTDSDIAALPHFMRDQLVLTKFLGSGAFGEVFEGVAKNILSDSSGETRVAVKTLRKSASDHEKEEFLKEAVLMSNFKHEHILSLLGVCLDNDPQFIILELMEAGDLLTFLRACRPSATTVSFLGLTDLVKICVHVARGCKYLEEMHFVHRDLAARNCLVSSKNPTDMVVKIGDFGLARDIYKNDYYRKEGEGLLPVRWMSPEALVDGVFTTKSDIWAFGVLIWEVMTYGRQPYPARTNIDVLHFVRQGGKLEQPDGCPEELFQLMMNCWEEPEKRPSFSLILQQLEDFYDKCVSLFEDYIVPIRTRNPPPEAGGSLRLQQIRGRKLKMRTSSLGHEQDEKNEIIYKKIHRATSFDKPEPQEAEDAEVLCRQLAAHNMSGNSDYLIAHNRGTPNYLELINGPNDRLHRKSSQGSSRHSSCSSDVYCPPLASSLHVELSPNKLFDFIHSIDSSSSDAPCTKHCIPEGYEFVPYPAHILKDKTSVEGYAYVKGPPRPVMRVDKSNSAYDIIEGPPKPVPSGSILPRGYKMVHLHNKNDVVGNQASADVGFDYSNNSKRCAYNRALQKVYNCQLSADEDKLAKPIPTALISPFTDSHNYVDCNRNKSSYPHLTSKTSDGSVAHSEYPKPVPYWPIANNICNHINEHEQGSWRLKGQIYPINDHLMTGYTDV